MADDYAKARKLGEKDYHRAITEGRYPYLHALDYLIREGETAGEEHLGVIEIPTELVKGTRTEGRQTAFSRNFYPLLAEGTEFAAKWSALCASQVEEGFHEPIKAYEFMQRFYVQEGNKRVSVMRYLGGPTIEADVTRVIPASWDGRGYRLYGEFLEFWRAVPLYDVTFSREGSFRQLADLMGHGLAEPWPEDEVRRLQGSYHYFAKAWEDCGGRHLDITTGDAMLVYLSVYSKEPLLSTPSDVLRERIGTLWREFMTQASDSGEGKVTGALRKAGKAVAAAGSAVAKPVAKVVEPVAKPVAKVAKAVAAPVAKAVGATGKAEDGQPEAKSEP